MKTNLLNKGHVVFQSWLQGGGIGNVMMGMGTSISWFLVGVEWINGHSGLFVALSAMASLVITIVGAAKAKKYRKENKHNEE